MNLIVRKAILDDCEKVYLLRNQPDIREICLNDEKINYESHQKWFAKVLIDKNRLLAVGELGGTFIGVIRLDYYDNEALISIFIDAKQSGQGYGSIMLQQAEVLAMQKWKKLKKLRAEILEDNINSISFFEKKGFQKRALVYYKHLTRCEK